MYIFHRIIFFYLSLFLVTNKIHILFSGVGEPFLDQNIRFHCPIYCVCNVNKILLENMKEKFDFMIRVITIC